MKVIIAMILAIISVQIALATKHISGKLDKLIEINTPEAIQLIVPDKPLLEDK